MPDDQHAAAGEVETDTEVIEAALRGRQRWPPALEALYERQRGPSRRAFMARATAVSGVLFLCAGVIDAIDSPALLWMALPWRVAMLLVAICCAACLRRCKPSARMGRLELTLTVAPPLAIMMLTQFVGEYGGRWGDRYMMAAVFAVTSFVVTTPMTLRTARWLSATAALAYPVFPWLLPYAVPLTTNLDLTVFAAGSLGTALLVAMRNEQARRANFLLHRRHEIAAAELNLMNAELGRLATVDALTGLQNRRAFTQALQRHWQDRRQTLALAIFDVDWFKAFNDSAGHAAGDAALQAVAGAAERAVRRGVDLAARIGGEEFAVIMPGVDRDQAAALSERLRREVAALDLLHPGRPGHTLSISVGVACCTPADRGRQTPDAFFNEADAALYAAKAGGRDRVAMAAPRARVAAG